MRIGILCPTYPPNDVPCGVGDFTKMLAPRLAEAGLEVRVFAGAGYAGPEEEGGVRIRKIPGGWGPASLGRIARASREEGIGALLVQYAPDLYPPAGRWVHFLPAAMRLLAPGIPPVFSMHTVGISTLASKAGAALMLASAPAILSTNEEITYLIGKHMRGAARKLREVPIGSSIQPPPDAPGGRRRFSAPPKGGRPRGGASACSWRAGAGPMAVGSTMCSKSAPKRRASAGS